MGIIVGIRRLILGSIRHRGEYNVEQTYQQYADGSNILFADGSLMVIGTKRVPVSKVPNPFLAGDGSQILFQDGQPIACEIVKEQGNK